MTSRRYAVERRPAITIMDGVRLGIGFFIVTVALYVFLFVAMIMLGVGLGALAPR